MQLLILLVFLLVGGLFAFGSWYYSNDQHTLRAMKSVPLLLPELEAFLADRGLTSQGFVFNKEMRFAEGVVESGETVAVVGIGSWERDSEEGPVADGYRAASSPRQLVMTNPPGEMLLLSDVPNTVT